MTILIIIFLLTGLLSGFLAGLLGVGGGIIIVPTTYFVLLNLGYSIDNAMHVAIASSLGIICFTSISSIRSHISLGNVDNIICGMDSKLNIISNDLNHLGTDIKEIKERIKVM